MHATTINFCDGDMHVMCMMVDGLVFRVRCDCVAMHIVYCLLLTARCHFQMIDTVLIDNLYG